MISYLESKIEFNKIDFYFKICNNNKKKILNYIKEMTKE